jgi:hypothetical protein
MFGNLLVIGEREQEWVICIFEYLEEIVEGM